MPKDRDKRFDDIDDAIGWELPETQLRAIGLLNEVIRMTPRNDPRLDHLLLLRHQLETDEHQLEEAQKVIAEFEEAYAKLTAPANRIGVFISHIDDETVQIALGDQEYIANVDPKLKKEGARGKGQEACDAGPRGHGDAATERQTPNAERPITLLPNTQHPIPKAKHPF